MPSFTRQSLRLKWCRHSNIRSICTPPAVVALELQPKSYQPELGKLQDPDGFLSSSAATPTSGFSSAPLTPTSPQFGELAAFFEKIDDRNDAKQARLQDQMEELLARSHDDKKQLTLMLMQLIQGEMKERLMSAKAESLALRLAAIEAGKAAQEHQKESKPTSVPTSKPEIEPSPSRFQTQSPIRGYSQSGTRAGSKPKTLTNRPHATRNCFCSMSPICSGSRRQHRIRTPADTPVVASELNEAEATEYLPVGWTIHYSQSSYFLAPSSTANRQEHRPDGGVESPEPEPRQARPEPGRARPEKEPEKELAENKRISRYPWLTKLLLANDTDCYYRCATRSR